MIALTRTILTFRFSSLDHVRKRSTWVRGSRAPYLRDGTDVIAGVAVEDADTRGSKVGK